MIGKDLCVEDLKLFKPHHIKALFWDEDYIVMLRSELAWEDLGGRYQYSFKKPNPNIKNSTETNSDPASSGNTASPSMNKKKTNVMHKNRMPYFLGLVSPQRLQRRRHKISGSIAVRPG